MDASGGPLAGVKVVDFTHLVAGPFCTVMLAGAGASVVKVEPPWGDSSRLRGARRTGPGGRHVSGYLVAGNRGKRSVVLDLKTDAGRSIALRLIAATKGIVSLLPGIETDHTSKVVWRRVAKRFHRGKTRPLFLLLSNLIK